MKKVIYPGSFDPITKGHTNIIDQASKLFDQVIVAILVNPNKNNSMFSPEERLAMIQELYQDNKKITVIKDTGATVDLALQNNCQAIVRGLRGINDFDYEYQLANINNDLSQNQVNTVCFFADPKYQNISSSMVKQIFNLDKPIDKYVDPLIKQKMLIRKKELL